MVTYTLDGGTFDVMTYAGEQICGAQIAAPTKHARCDEDESSDHNIG